MRLNADLESGRSLVSHPRRKAGKGAVKLVHNDETRRRLAQAAA